MKPRTIQVSEGGEAGDSDERRRDEEDGVDGDGLGFVSAQVDEDRQELNDRQPGRGDRGEDRGIGRALGLSTLPYAGGKAGKIHDTEGSVAEPDGGQLSEDSWIAPAGPESSCND